MACFALCDMHTCYAWTTFALLIWNEKMDTQSALSVCKKLDYEHPI